jgi:hypothetical protein
VHTNCYNGEKGGNCSACRRHGPQLQDYGTFLGDRVCACNLCECSCMRMFHLNAIQSIMTKEALKKSLSIDSAVGGKPVMERLAEFLSPITLARSAEHIGGRIQLE